MENVVVEGADAPVEYFNLQGVRVAAPEAGIFIRRQGNKVEKVVIRWNLPSAEMTNLIQ